MAGWVETSTPPATPGSPSEVGPDGSPNDWLDTIARLSRELPAEPPSPTLAAGVSGVNRVRLRVVEVEEGRAAGGAVDQDVSSVPFAMDQPGALQREEVVGDGARRVQHRLCQRSGRHRPIEATEQLRPARAGTAQLRLPARTPRQLASGSWNRAALSDRRGLRNEPQYLSNIPEMTDGLTSSGFARGWFRGSLKRLAAPRASRDIRHLSAASRTVGTS